MPIECASRRPPPLLNGFWETPPPPHSDVKKSAYCVRGYPPDLVLGSTPLFGLFCTDEAKRRNFLKELDGHFSLFLACFSINAVSYN